MSKFINTILPHKRISPRTLGRCLNILRSDSEWFSCCICGYVNDIKVATIEHVRPTAVVVNASFGKLKNSDCDIKLACYKCNQDNSRIPSSLGTIWKSRNINEIKDASRFLCNLVRPKKNRKQYKPLSFSYLR